MTARTVRCEHKDNVRDCKDCWPKFSGEANSTEPVPTIRQVLEQLGTSNVPGTGGQFHEVDPTAINWAEKQLQRICASERLDELRQAKLAKLVPFLDLNSHIKVREMELQTLIEETPSE